jgi:hypothetical protein
MHFGVWILDGEGISQFRCRSTAKRVRRIIEAFGMADARVLRALVKYVASKKRKGWNVDRIICDFVNRSPIFREVYKSRPAKNGFFREPGDGCAVITSGFLSISMPEKEADNV